MSKPVPFDDMIDVAFAEIYHEACTMEKEKKIEPDNTTEEFARDCKQLAADYCEIYDRACQICGEPSFYDGLYPWAQERLKKMYPPTKRFDVLIDAQMTLTWPVFAKDKEEAEALAAAFMSSAKFGDVFRKEANLYEAEVGDVIEP